MLNKNDITLNSYSELALLIKDTSIQDQQRKILTEMDGFDKPKSPFVIIAATNHIERIALPVLSRCLSESYQCLNFDCNSLTLFNNKV